MTAPALAPAVCSSYIGARRLRVTRLDRCGRPINHPRGYAVSSGFVSVELSPEVEEGEDYSLKSADGSLCVSEKGPDSIKWMNVSIEFCRVDPDIFTLMNPTWKLVTNAQGQATGFRIGQRMSDQDGFALDLWPKVSGGGAGCDDEDDVDPDPNFPVDPSGYFLLPWVIPTAPESWTLENGTATFTISGRTKVGSRWRRGPWAVTRDAHGQPTNLLVPIEDGLGSSGVLAPDGSYDPDHFHADQVTLSPPPARCGAQPLVIPQFTTTAEGLTVTVEVANAADLAGEDNDPVYVMWDDGSPYELLPTEGTITHTYAEPGTYDVRVMAANYAIAAQTVVLDQATAVTVEPAEAEVPAAGELNLTATAEMALGDTKDVTAEATWSVADPANGVSVDGGVVTVAADATPGDTATVNATYQGQTDSATITITPAVAEGLAVAPTTGEVVVGDSEGLTLTATATIAGGTELDVTSSAEWSTNAEQVTVQAGVVTASAVPATNPVTVTATYQEHTATAEVTVTEPEPPPVESVAVEPATATVAAGETVQLAAQATAGGETTDVTADAAWSSSDETVTVEAGLVTVPAEHAGGEVTVTAEYEGQQGTATVTVTPAAQAETFGARRRR